MEGAAVLVWKNHDMRHGIVLSSKPTPGWGGGLAHGEDAQPTEGLPEGVRPEAWF